MQVSASWDREVIQEWGKRIGWENKAKGGSAELGPAINL